MSNGRVTAGTEAARAAGIRRGQRLRDAQRYCPGVIVHANDPEAQAREFEPIVAVVEDVCPRVEVVRPGLVAVPARGPSRYYGGERVAAETVRDAVLGKGVACAIGAADGAFAANLAARSAWDDAADGGDGDGVSVVPTSETAEFLAPHPVSVLEAPELTAVLVRLGIRTLADFAALSAKDVLARFGAEGAIAHRLASGQAGRPAATRPPTEDLSIETEFDPPVEQSEPAVFAAKRLADSLHTELGSRGLTCQRVEVEATTADGESRSRLWRHDGLLSPLAVAERVRWQLDAWRTSGVLTGPITRLCLAPDGIVVDTGRQLGLWGHDTLDEDVDRAATRIQVMLGHAAVTRPVLSGGRGPAEQIVRVPWGDTPDLVRSTDQRWPGQVPSPAPSVVPPSPAPAQVLDADGDQVIVSGRSVVSSPPDRLIVRRETKLVTGWTGPWPVWEHWWSADGRRFARFQVVTDDGEAWLLRIENGTWSIEAHYT
jgi:protein ImuB